MPEQTSHENDHTAKDIDSGLSAPSSDSINGRVAAPLPCPVEVVDADDPGDDTTRRFRYQWAYGAILCLALLKEDPEFAFVYCEHHEDILLACLDGKFCGIQVKTRAEGYETFKASEEPIVKSLQRFVALEIKFGDQFRRYTIATNCGFWTQDETRDNLKFVQKIVSDCASNSTALGSNRVLSNIVTKLKLIQGCTDAVIASMFAKLVLQSEMPTLRDAHLRLVSHLDEHDDVSGLTLKEVSTIGYRLTDLVGRASSRECEPTYKDYAAVMRDPQGAADQAIIEGKRIDADAVRQLIAVGRTPENILRGLENPDLPQLDRGRNRLERKMDAGGISMQNITNLKDLKDAAEHHGLQMLNTYGEERGAQRWNHVRTLVQNQCHEAHDDAETNGGAYGKAMLANVRTRLKSLYNEEKQSLFDCRYEHLLGVAAVLTQDCKVWWSEPFTIEGE